MKLREYYGEFKVRIMVISMVSIKVSIMVSIKVRQNINKMKWMNHISALRDFLAQFLSHLFVKNPAMRRYGSSISFC